MSVGGEEGSFLPSLIFVGLVRLSLAKFQRNQLFRIAGTERALVQYTTVCHCAAAIHS